MAPKSSKGTAMEEFCPMSDSDVADMEEVRDNEDSGILSDEGTHYRSAGEDVFDAGTAERLKETFSACVEESYVVNKAKWDMFFKRARARTLHLGVGRRIISPQHAYTESEKIEAGYFCEYGPVGCKIDA